MIRIDQPYWGRARHQSPHNWLIPPLVWADIVAVAVSLLALDPEIGLGLRFGLGLGWGLD